MKKTCGGCEDCRMGLFCQILYYTITKMRLKLSYKFFVAFSLTSLLVVALLVGMIRFYVARNFADYVNKSRLEKLQPVSAALAAEYQSSNGWRRLKNNPDLWKEILRSNLRPPDIEIKESDFNTKEKSPETPPSHVLRRESRMLAVFDDSKQHIVGGRENYSYDGYTLKKITVSGKTAGWLGLYKRVYLENPLAIGFLKQQSQALYIIGGLILALAALVAFLLSKHILAPIRELTAGTRALASRVFNTRISVASQDELGQLAEDFNMMAHTLEEYEHMRKQWISDISHELRTPLSILRGEIEALEDGVREINDHTLDSLHSEISHLSNIVNDLHELSLADAGEFTLNKVPLEPLVVLKETLGHFQQRFAENQIVLENSLETLSPLSIMGDANRLQQLFSNLLENTLQYMDVPGVLRVGQELKANRLTIIIEDSGPGVPEEALGHLFDRLYRVDQSRNRNQGGSGLGLSICKSIVNAHEGEIRAANGDSGGLRIEIEFPVNG